MLKWPTKRWACHPVVNNEQATWADGCQVFAGPMSESVPSSVTGFAHRRARADSIASFTFFREDDESLDWSEDQAIAIDDDDDDGHLDRTLDVESEYDLESGSISPQRRISSGSSQSAIDHSLLHRHDSAKTNTSAFGRTARRNQKIYVMAEDLTIVVAGFSTNWVGFWLYLTLCLSSGGLLYLMFRWLPSWRVKVVGSPTPLRECEWVVIEVSLSRRHHILEMVAKQDQNQWGELEILDIIKTSYGHSVSTVFGAQEKRSFAYYYDEDDDPVVTHLRFLDYRYVRFCFHPYKDKFVLISDWRDPDWKDVKTMRIGLGSDERHRREQVFDKNHIDIKEKTVAQLLVDEVRAGLGSVISWNREPYAYTWAGFPPFLYLSNCKSHIVVSRLLLLLRYLHIRDIRNQHHNDVNRNKIYDEAPPRDLPFRVRGPSVAERILATSHESRPCPRRRL